MFQWNFIYIYTDVHGSSGSDLSWEQYITNPWSKVSLKLPNLSPKVAKSCIINIPRLSIQVSNHPTPGYQKILAPLKSSIMFSLRNSKRFCIGGREIYKWRLLEQAGLRITPFIRVDCQQSACSNMPSNELASENQNGEETSYLKWMELSTCGKYPDI